MLSKLKAARSAIYEKLVYTFDLSLQKFLPRTLKLFPSDNVQQSRAFL